MKSGKSGRLAFVTVTYRYLQQGTLCIEEAQDIVYREPGGRVSAPVAQAWPPVAEGSSTRLFQPDNRLLFRFSALTFNAHRIPCDRVYAGEVEGYPGPVVHGPLTALLLSEPVRHSTARPLRAFSFRGVAPLPRRHGGGARHCNAGVIRIQSSEGATDSHVPPGR